MMQKCKNCGMNDETKSNERIKDFVCSDCHMEWINDYPKLKLQNKKLKTDNDKLCKLLQDALLRADLAEIRGSECEIKLEEFIETHNKRIIELRAELTNELAKLTKRKECLVTFEMRNGFYNNYNECDELVRKEDVFCRKCGGLLKEITPIDCTQCGFTCFDNRKKCKRCGAEIKRTKELDNDKRDD